MPEFKKRTGRVQFIVADPAGYAPGGRVQVGVFANASETYQPQYSFSLTDEELRDLNYIVSAAMRFIRALPPSGVAASDP